MDQTDGELCNLWQLRDTCRFCTVVQRLAPFHSSLRQFYQRYIQTRLKCSISTMYSHKPAVHMYFSKCHLCGTLPSAALFLALHWTQVMIKYLFAVSRTKVEHRFSAESSKIIAPIPHPPGCMSFVHVLRARVTSSHQLFLVSLCVSFLVQRKYQNLQIAQKVRTQKVARKIQPPDCELVSLPVKV